MAAKKNLEQGLDNLLRVYQPKLIGVLTTCLAETIGEDVERMLKKYLGKRGLGDFPLVGVATPGYGGSHTEGYFMALRQIVTKLACQGEQEQKINIILPNISPADVREVKRILNLLQVKYTLLPDISETLDQPFSRPYHKVAKEGTKLEDIRKMGSAMATIEMGETIAPEISPGKYLKEKFKVPYYQLPLPMGVENTDKLVQLLSQLGGHPIPESLVRERGRLLDGMVDSHKYNFLGKAVIFGEPELVNGVTSICLENGIDPLVVATGSNNAKLEKLLKPIFKQENIDSIILNDSDFVAIRLASAKAGVNIAIGNSDGRYLTEKEGIPLVRIGFPIHDRVGGQRLMSLGYTGTMQFLDRITNTLLENKYKNYRQDMYRQFYPGGGENVM